jgi:small ligand-binding sensory domain FIST
MSPAFAFAHASHADWSKATESCLVQLAQQRTAVRRTPEDVLGFVYLSDGLRANADRILALLKTRTGIADWAGCSSIGVCATGIEYYDEPALALMIGRFPAGSVQVFSGTQRPPDPGSRTPSGAEAASAALVHADPATPDLPGLVTDMAGKVTGANLFGGVSSGRAQTGPSVQIANRVLCGGISGVVFGSDVNLVSRLTQGCHPLAGAQRHRVTRIDNNLIMELDGRNAVEVLLDDAGIALLEADAIPVQVGDRRLQEHLKGLGRRGLFVGIEISSGAASRKGSASRDYVIRDVVGIDPARGVIAIATKLETGRVISFCSRDEAAARRDLVRICSEIREHLADPSRRSPESTGRSPGSRGAAGRSPQAPAAAGAIYVSCLARSSHLFGETSEELRVIQSQLGDVPLVGFFAAGEVRGTHLYGHSGVLTVFC